MHETEMQGALRDYGYKLCLVGKLGLCFIPRVAQPEIPM